MKKKKTQTKYLKKKTKIEHKREPSSHHLPHNMPNSCCPQSIFMVNPEVDAVGLLESDGIFWANDM